MKNIFVIDGANGSGKSDLIKYVKEKYTTRKFVDIITKYTTRLERPEEEGKVLDLEFIDAELFNQFIEKDNFLFYHYGEHRYGFYEEQIYSSLEKYSNVFVIVRNKSVAKEISESFSNTRVVKVFIYSDPDKIKNRLIEEGVDQGAIDYRLRRLNTAWEDYLSHTHKYSEVLINNGSEREYHRLIDYLIEKYNSPDPNYVEIDNEHSYQLIKPLIGFKSNLTNAIKKYDFHKNVFLMMKFREDNILIYQFIKDILKEEGFNCIRADEPEINVTNNIYNPLAVAYLCKYGIALFDEPEKGNEFSPNVSYELGLMHAHSKECLVLKHKDLPQMPFDLLKDLYITYSDNLEIRKIIKKWLITIRK